MKTIKRIMACAVFALTALMFSSFALRQQSPIYGEPTQLVINDEVFINHYDDDVVESNYVDTLFVNLKSALNESKDRLIQAVQLAEVTVVPEVITEQPTLTEIRTYMLEVGVHNVDVAIKQILYHTDNLTCITDNNLFGMKYPKKRETTAISSKNGYAQYNSWQASVLDYKFWQSCFKVAEMQPSEYVQRIIDIGYVESNHSQYSTYLLTT